MSTSPATVAGAGATSEQIIHHSNEYLSKTLSSPDLRHNLFSSFQRKNPSSNSDQITLNLAVETIENAIRTTNPFVKSSSLTLSEKLLISISNNLFASFLLSLVHSLSSRPIEATLSLLDVFISDPSLARTDIAPKLFEELFLIHFIPVLDWFNDKRAKIMSLSITRLNLLSKMSSDQTSQIKMLEQEYSKVLDQNCRVFAQYFSDVLVNSRGKNRLIHLNLPSVVLETIEEKGDELELIHYERNEARDSGISNPRNNPIWIEEEEEKSSVEFLNNNNGKILHKFPSFYPERVSPNVLTGQISMKNKKSDTISEEDSDSDSDQSSCSNSDADAEQERRNPAACRIRIRIRIEPVSKIFNNVSSESSTNIWTFLVTRSQDILTDHSLREEGRAKQPPPKDFVCPITSQIFNDPVTLETGQTYERRAIQEWIDRGNSTCPITRQELRITQLPNTNYVLKRLIANWIELSLSSLSHTETSPSIDSTMHSTSPNSVITHANVDATVTELRLAITSLCTSEILKESEMAVIRIEKFWRETSMDVEILSMLSKAEVINGFVEILFNSVDPQVLSATVYLLSELGSREDGVIQTLTRVDSDVDCIAALFKKGYTEAVVLIHLLKPPSTSLIEMDIAPELLDIIGNPADDSIKMFMHPKKAAIFVLADILGGAEASFLTEIAKAIIATEVMGSIIETLQASCIDERAAAAVILLRCIQVEGKCRNLITHKANLSRIMETNIGARFEIVQFLSELVKLNRRTSNEQILHIIKDEGSYSTMHTLLVYLQTALKDQCPVVAGFLLQLDLLEEPRKMSIYREEAIDYLISSLKESESPTSQIAAAEMILALQGSFSSSGKPLIRSVLLKRAGIVKRTNRRHENSEEDEEEEKAADEWEKKVAYVLVSHEFGLIFEALAEGLKSRYAELGSACFLSATWLVYMLDILPDTGIRGAARVCLLKRFISIFKSAKDIEDKALAMLALNSFIHDTEGLREISMNMKDILKGLRELKKYSSMAFDMLKALSEGHESSCEIWNHKEIIQEDSSVNGEVSSMICYEDKIFSGHSDGTIKVWLAKGNNLRLIQEVKEHSKVVTSLRVLHPGDKLYSGSLDRTVRVWTISGEIIQCTQIHDMKDHVNNLVVANSLVCFIPQGAGIKVHMWSGGSKLLLPNKYVKCLDLVHGKLYCGCHDNSIQEIELATGTITTIQSGSRKLLVKANPIQAMNVHDGLIYSASSSSSSSMDGAVKIWNVSNYSMVGSLASTMEVRAMAISSELIYLGGKGGAVEVWCRKKANKVETLNTGINSKIVSMALNNDEDVLVIGTSDGKIQVWGLT
ncbi:putative E3 ubiquitin-protein ligase LIN-1 [Impatiens glandulifera]|uniref:putative E3 ubiquitin-protein ligase LIN-1 n=1 Tax=Impatiens glandulifera TaxID=253017 RepID=UPI001FB19EB3|nr:putative E3 ubiquitin-protein ligase LIN-1 [Impatiens glandulifera]